MCGLTGFVDPALPGSATPDDVLRGMAATIVHRGPDDEGYWYDLDAGVALGFRRLAIQDLSQAGHQPMSSHSGRYVLLFNGEMYNFSELRRELEGHGFRFRGHSDTEVLLAAIEHVGPEAAVAKVRGMFGIVLWDCEERVLWLARDRMGIKPMYVARRGPAVVFGSELRALLEHPRIDRAGSREAAWHYLRCLYVPAPLSIVEGVEKVMPGTLVRFSVGDRGVEEQREIRYWDLEQVASQEVRCRAPEETVEELDELLNESVRMRLVADVPVGALLSGGVDSSLVVSLMARHSERPVRTFTIRFDDERFDEGPVAEKVASALGAAHTAVRLPTSDVREMVPELGDILDEPTANPSFLPTLLVSRVAREHVTVALSGDGGDELFGGYNRYVRGPRLVERAGRVPRALRPGLGAALRVAAGLPGIEALAGMLQPAELGAQHTFGSRIRRASGVFGADSPGSAYRELMAVGHAKPPILGGTSGGRVDTEAFDRHEGTLFARMTLADQLQYLPDDLLAKVDRASMWTSLEARVPILDHEVVDFSWSVPDGHKVRDGRTKWPLRELVNRYLPPGTAEGPKMGFTVPLEKWLRQDLRPWVADTLSDDGLAARGLYDRSAVRSLWNRFDAGGRDLAMSLWTLAVLEDWCSARDVSFT